MEEYKYPKTIGYYVYVHITPDEMFYIGMTKLQPCDRWYPSSYKTTSLQPYIEQYGWGNIKHVILKDGLTDKQAEQLEDLLIQEAKRQGFCINKKGSGGKRRDNPNEYQRECRQKPEVQEREREYNREYNQRPEVKEHRREYQREYDKKRDQTEKRKEYHREYQRQYRLKKKALKN